MNWGDMDAYGKGAVLMIGTFAAAVFVVMLA